MAPVINININSQDHPQHSAYKCPVAVRIYIFMIYGSRYEDFKVNHSMAEIPYLISKIFIVFFNAQFHFYFILFHLTFPSLKIKHPNQSVSCKDTSSMIYNLCFKNYMGPWDNFMGDTIYTRVSSSSYICNVLELEYRYVCLVPH